MKKKTLLLLFLCAISVKARLWEGARQASGEGAKTGIAFLVFQPAQDFSDLDVRDAENHLIQTAQAHDAMADLFRENLLNLTVLASPHIATQAVDWLISISALVNNLILSRLAILFSLFQDALLPPTRRFVHNVHNLCITFSVGIMAGCLLLSCCPLLRSPRQIYLRC